MLFVGSLGERKGVKDLLEILPLLSEEFPDCHLTVVGTYESESARKSIESLRRRLPLKADTVSFSGPLEYRELRDAYAASSVFVLPSYQENSPMSILEAMASGLPVVSTRVGAIPDVVEDGVNGFLIQPGDIDALRDRIRRLFKDEALVERMRRANIEKIAEKYDIMKINAVILGLYRQMSA